MHQYHQALKDILKHGKVKTDRTGTGTKSIFGYQMRFNLQDGFPAVTTKKLAWNAVVSELLWFLEGSGDERRLCEILHGTRDDSRKTIWSENASADYWAPKAKFAGDLGRVYGIQWRDFSGTDQIVNLINGIKKDPDSRRHIVVSYNPAEIDQMALPPCHAMFQMYVADGELSCQLYQRSADFPLGVPFNIASYSLLTHMIAQLCNLKVGEFIHSIGDAHIYLNQIDGVNIQLEREPLPLPSLEMPKFTTLEELLATKVSDYKLLNYQHHGTIAYPFAV